MEQKKAQQTSSVLLSDVDADLLGTRLPGGEFLLNHMLAQASHESLTAIAYLLHDWILANRGQFKSFASYFDQPKEQIDEAVALFAQNHHDICTPKDLKPGEFSLLPLYLFYDCLLHVGAVKRDERPVGYLTQKFNEAKSIGIDDFLKFAKSGQVYNYVRINGQTRIASKNYYHSEIADGRPVQGAGEIELTRDMNESIEKIRLNYFTGHYRVPADTVNATAEDVEKAVAAQMVTSSQRPPRVFISENSLNKRTI